MRINQNISSINFSSSYKNTNVSKNNTDTESRTVQNLSKTPDYQVKRPQKYTKIETTDLPTNLKAHIYKLESGQKVLIIPKDGPTVIKTYINTGSLNEKDDERGISHFVEHSLFNGSEGLSEGEFFETVNKMGANTNASTGFSATDYYIKSNLLKDSDLNTQIRIHASMLETPKFTPKMIEKEKNPVTSEISMILDDTENIAINSTIKNLFNIKTTSTDIIGGTIENINNLTRDKVMKYYKENYFPANMVTVITGDVDEKETIALVAKHMHSHAKTNKNRKYEKLTAIDKTIRQDITSNKAPSAFISIGLKGPKNNNTKEQIIFDAIGYILTGSTVSRINKNLEDIQTEASIDLERLSSKLTDNMAILISAPVDDKNTEIALQKINSALESLASNPPSENEINIIKKNLKFDFMNGFEKSSNLNSLIGGAMLDGNLSIITDYEKVIDSLTPQDFVDFSKKYLDVNKESITVIHPAKKGTISFAGRKPINTNNIETKTLSNNALLIENSTNKNIAYIDLKISGDIDNVKLGTIELLSRMLERGTAEKSKDEFYNEVEKNGIMLGFLADSKSIQASSAFMIQDTKLALKKIKEVITNPRFNDEDFNEVKKQAIQDLKDLPVNAKDGLYKKLFKDEIKGTTQKELLKEIKNITLDEVKELHQNLLKDSQLQVAISGPFKNEFFKNNVEEELSKELPQFKPFEVKKTTSFKPLEKAEVVTVPHYKSQAEIITGYKFKIEDNSPQKMIRYSLLNIILGSTAPSRLFNDLRENQKLAYHVKSFIEYNDNDTGVCNLYIKTTTDSKNTYKNIEKSINGFEKHVRKLVNEKVSSEELENAKLVLKNRILNDNETTSNKNSTLLSNIQTETGIDLTNKLLEIVDNINVQDIQDAANEIFSNPPVCSIAAKQEALDNNKTFLKNLFQ